MRRFIRQKVRLALLAVAIGATVVVARAPQAEANNETARGAWAWTYSGHYCQIGGIHLINLYNYPIGVTRLDAGTPYCYASHVQLIYTFDFVTTFSVDQTQGPGGGDVVRAGYQNGFPINSRHGVCHESPAWCPMPVWYH